MTDFKENATAQQLSSMRSWAARLLRNAKQPKPLRDARGRFMAHQTQKASPVIRNVGRRSPIPVARPKVKVVLDKGPPEVSVTIEVSNRRRRGKFLVLENRQLNALRRLVNKQHSFNRLWEETCHELFGLI